MDAIEMCGHGCGCRRDAQGECDPSADLHPCTAAADAILAQADRFIADLDDGAYARPCSAASGGTIGRHVRHCLDHFAAVLAGARPIDYDHRERHVPMETDPMVARCAIAEARRRLRHTGRPELDEPVSIRVMVDSQGCTVELGSTLARELAFATHHALHHHAMMKFIAESFGISTPEEFGKAPSTLNHERGAAVPLPL